MVFVTGIVVIMLVSITLLQWNDSVGTLFFFGAFFFWNIGKPILKKVLKERKNERVLNKKGCLDREDKLSQVDEHNPFEIDEKGDSKVQDEKEMLHLRGGQDENPYQIQRDLPDNSEEIETRDSRDSGKAWGDKIAGAAILLALLVFTLSFDACDSNDVSYEYEPVRHYKVEWSAPSNDGSMNWEVAPEAREKYTTLLGNGEDTVTLMLYLCGADLESEQGMGTAVLNELMDHVHGDHVNVIVCTGGAKSWKNGWVKADRNQVFRIHDGTMECLVNSLSGKSMTDPGTLKAFIQWADRNYPANRRMLILSDHGGGDGFGNDERYPNDRPMSLSQMQYALKCAGVTFDFIGFDACLMGTLEMGLMLSDYADYMIASEDVMSTGWDSYRVSLIGWDYSKWVDRLCEDPSIPTLNLLRGIADHAAESHSLSVEGRPMSLAVTDLAELSVTVPPALDAFASEIQKKLEDGYLEDIASLRAGTQESDPENLTDHIDLVDFAWRSELDSGRNLAEVLLSAVKYNRVSRYTSSHYGLAAWFPHQNLDKVDKKVKMYKETGFPEGYTNCVRRYAQVKAMTQLLQETHSGSLTRKFVAEWISRIQSKDFSKEESDLLKIRMNLDPEKINYLEMEGLGFSAFRNFVQMAQITEEDLVEDPDRRGGILLAQEQWARVSGINRYMLLDEGEAGQLEMGLLKDSPPDDPDGYLKLNLDEKWVTVENKSVAFYQTADAVESDSGALIPGYIPVRLNGREARLTAQFDLNSGEGTITGISLMNGNQKDAIQRDVTFELKKGDVIEFFGKFRDKEGQEFDRTLWFYTAPSDLNEWTVEYKAQEDSRWRIIYEFVLNTGGAIQSQPFIPREREEPAVQAAA